MGRERQNSAAQILLVEDHPGDVRLVREALREAEVNGTLHTVSNGVEAVAFLRRLGDNAAAPRPDLILLDLDMPMMDGPELLREIKWDQDLRSIPIVVLSTSDGDDVVRRSYELHANCFVTKPFDLDEFSEVVRAIDQFWFGVARLPRG